MKYILLLLIALDSYLTVAGQNPSQRSKEVANIYVISQAFAFTPKDTIDITNSFVSDTSAIVIVNDGRDSLFFSIANIRGEQMCVGEVMRENGMTIDTSIVAYSGDFVCNIGKIAHGNHFFITAIEGSQEKYGVMLYMVDIVLEQEITLRFIAALTEGQKLEVPQ